MLRPRLDGRHGATNNFARHAIRLSRYEGLVRRGLRPRGYSRCSRPWYDDLYLPHQELLGVASVLLSRHSSRLVGTLPHEYIAIRSAFCCPTSRPLVLSASDKVDTLIAQFARDEVIVEQGVSKHHITGFEGVIHASEKTRLAVDVTDEFWVATEIGSQAPRKRLLVTLRPNVATQPASVSKLGYSGLFAPTLRQFHAGCHTSYKNCTYGSKAISSKVRRSTTFSMFSSFATAYMVISAHACSSSITASS